MKNKVSNAELTDSITLLWQRVYACEARAKEIARNAGTHLDTLGNDIDSVRAELVAKVEQAEACINADIRGQGRDTTRLFNEMRYAIAKANTSLGDAHARVSSVAELVGDNANIGNANLELQIARNDEYATMLRRHELTLCDHRHETIELEDMLRSLQAWAATLFACSAGALLMIVWLLLR
jgi:hypothetical protein